MKRVITIILVVLLSVLTLGGAYFLGKQIAYSNVTPKDDTPVALPEGDENKSSYENAESGYMHADKEEEDNLTVLLSSIEEEDYGLMGIPEDAESCIAVQAYVLPEYATNKGITWELSFVDPNASWVALMSQEGLTMEDYVQVIPQGDNKLALACMNPFGEKIQLKIMSSANPSIFATVILDYEVRIIQAYLQALTKDGEMCYSNFSMSNVMDNNSSLVNIGEYYQETKKFYKVNLVTTAATFGRESVLQMRLNPEFVDYLKDAGFEMKDAAYEPFTLNAFADNCFAVAYCGLYFADDSMLIEGQNPFINFYGSFTDEVKNLYRNAVNAFIEEKGVGRLITFTYYYGEVSAPKAAYNLHMGSDQPLFTFDVTGLETDTGNVIF